MGKKADALRVELDSALTRVEELEEGLNMAYGVMTPVSRKKFLQKANPDVARAVSPKQEG